MGYETIRLEKPFVVDEIISIHYFEYTSTYSFEGESHNFWEFLYVDKGEVSVCAGECQHILQKGQIIFPLPHFPPIWATRRCFGLTGARALLLAQSS